MFVRKNRLRKDLPAIDIRKKPVRGLFGKTKWVAASRKEKKKMKAVMKKLPLILIINLHQKKLILLPHTWLLSGLVNN